VSVYYLATDPGKTSGWATFDEQGNGITIGQANIQDFIKLLETTEAKIIITEDYMLFPWKAKEQIWSKLDTVRVIGMIQYICYKRDIELVLQDPGIKGIGYYWAGIPKAKQHKISHERDAYVHGVYYLQKNGVRRPQQGEAK